MKPLFVFFKAYLETIKYITVYSFLYIKRIYMKLKCYFKSFKLYFGITDEESLFSDNCHYYYNLHKSPRLISCIRQWRCFGMLHGCEILKIESSRYNDSNVS